MACSEDPSSTLGVKWIRGRPGRLEQAERHAYGVTGPNLSDANRMNYATLTYNDAGQTLTEAHCGGTLAGRSM